MDKINLFKISSNDEFAKEFNYFMLSDSENEIIVEFDVLTEEKIRKFKKKISDSPAIRFKQSEGYDSEEVSLKSGAKISNSTAYASIGYHKGHHNGYAQYIKANSINAALGTTRY